MMVGVPGARVVCTASRMLADVWSDIIRQVQTLNVVSIFTSLISLIYSPDDSFLHP